MKRFKKDYLKSIKVAGFKWDTNPLDMYKACADGNGDIQVSKRDLKKLMDMAMRRHAVNLGIIESLGHQLGF